MNVYLDASVLVPLFLDDPFTQRAEALLRTPDTRLHVSDWAVLEVSNVIQRRVRIQALAPPQARATLTDFDLWRGRSTLGAETTTLDVAVATLLVRRLDLTLRSPDAVHLAIAQRMGSALWTFDQRMADAAVKIGLETTR